MIKCQLCNKEVHPKAFPSHLKVHNLTREEYALKFPMDFPNYKPCPICGTMTWGVTCSIKCNGIRNGNLTVESGRTLGDKNPMRKSDIAKRVAKIRGDNFKAGISKPAMLGKKHSDTSRALQSKRAIERTQQPDYVNPMQGKTHTPEAIKKIFEKRPMNKLERLAADVLDAHGIEYYFQFFINDEGICKSYDFKIKDSNLIFEINGDYWHGGPGVDKHCATVNETIENDKIKYEIAKKHGYRVISVWESAVKTNPEILFDLYLHFRHQEVHS